MFEGRRSYCLKVGRDGLTYARVVMALILDVDQEVKEIDRHHHPIRVV